MANARDARLLKYRCFNPEVLKERFNDDGISTFTSEEQRKVEDNVQTCFEYIRKAAHMDEECPLLLRERHVTFLKKGLLNLPQAYQDLDASQPWLCYWILHSLELLDEPLYSETKSHVVEFLSKCQHEDGGFSGGCDQQAHLAPTYAAVNALCILGTEESYSTINRDSLRRFLYKMRQPDGSFIMHEGGESDVRGAYCALSVARLTNIYTPTLFEGTADWILRCQTYEGGFGGVPGMEAHGGYTFCGFAALALLGREHSCDIRKLLRWITNRQMRFEGGFQGRTNKLVDGCYSFWQGGTFPLLHLALFTSGCKGTSTDSWLFNQEALQEYILVCCQAILGGLIDKPGKHRDFYHTCYTLSGLSVAQHFASGDIGKTCIVGDCKNELIPVHPLYNIGVFNTSAALKYFSRLT